MEWIETTGKTVEEARELALDQLGVDESEAEFEVVAEPKAGLFGRTRGVARVRARVSPKAPRPKSDRKRRPARKKDGAASAGVDSARSEKKPEAKKDTQSGGQGQNKQAQQAPKAKPDAASKQSSNGADQGQRNGSKDRAEKKPTREPMDTQQQIDVVEGFLTGLLEAFGLTGTFESTIEEKDLRTNIVGENLGLLVGPRLGTLEAVQELARLALQREAEGKEYARVTIDVAGIRDERRASLERFVVDVSKQVSESNKTVVFEEMSSVDRKHVHDLASGIDGVKSVSEGEDPRRRVALVPAESA